MHLYLLTSNCFDIYIAQILTNRHYCFRGNMWTDLKEKYLLNFRLFYKTKVTPNLPRGYPSLASFFLDLRIKLQLDIEFICLLLKHYFFSSVLTLGISEVSGPLQYSLHLQTLFCTRKRGVR